jgi:hypothetical protein
VVGCCGYGKGSSGSIQAAGILSLTQRVKIAVFSDVQQHRYDNLKCCGPEIFKFSGRTAL